MKKFSQEKVTPSHLLAKRYNSGVIECANAFSLFLWKGELINTILTLMLIFWVGSVTPCKIYSGASTVSQTTGQIR